MGEAIGSALKVFVEKELIPTTIALVGAILILVLCPEDYWVIGKIGKTFFVLLVAGLIFLAIALIRWICRVICNKLHSSSLKKENKEYDKQLYSQKMEELWSAVDSLSPNDRMLLREFIQNKNEPIVRSAGERYLGNTLLNSSWVISTEEYVESQNEDKVSAYGVGIYMPYEMPNISRTIVKKYKLRDEMYEILKWSCDTYGKISHFE